MKSVVDINADIGESFGRWKLGNDKDLIPLVTSVNIACGFHGGDPRVMHETVQAAEREGVALGAHPGYPDLLGFGRRAMSVDRDDVRDYCLYQVGALREFARYFGLGLQHVKPHGSLYANISRDKDLAEYVAEAIRRVDEDLILVLLANSVSEHLLTKGFRIARGAFADLDYNDDGSIIIEPQPAAKDPMRVAMQALSIAKGAVRSVNDRVIEVDADTICIHGDRPNAAAVGKQVKDLLLSNGIDLAPCRAVIG